MPNQEVKETHYEIHLKGTYRHFSKGIPEEVEHCDICGIKLDEKTLGIRKEHYHMPICMSCRKFVMVALVLRSTGDQESARALLGHGVSSFDVLLG